MFDCCPMNFQFGIKNATELELMSSFTLNGQLKWMCVIQECLASQWC